VLSLVGGGPGGGIGLSLGALCGGGPVGLGGALGVEFPVAGGTGVLGGGGPLGLGRDPGVNLAGAGVLGGGGGGVACCCGVGTLADIMET